MEKEPRDQLIMSKKLVAKWIGRRIESHRLSDVHTKEMTVSLEWINVQKNPHTYVWSHNHADGVCGESPDCERSQWGTAPLDVGLITVTEAAPCWRCMEEPCKQPALWVHASANIILLWHQISLKGIKKGKEERRSVQFPATWRRKHHTIVGFISKLCEVLRGKYERGPGWLIETVTLPGFH